MRTLEQITEDHRKRVYGTCFLCKTDFKYGDEPLDLSGIVCYSSGGEPDTFVQNTIRFHRPCLKEYASKMPT